MVNANQQRVSARKCAIGSPHGTQGQHSRTEKQFYLKVRFLRGGYKKCSRIVKDASYPLAAFSFSDIFRWRLKINL